MIINPKKCSFCAEETEYLGYFLTRDGIKPQPKEVQTIIALTPPQNFKQLCRFLGMAQTAEISRIDVVKFYSHLPTWLKNVAHQAIKAVKSKRELWHWYSLHQTASDNEKKIIAKDTVLAYPDYIQGFDAH